MITTELVEYMRKNLVGGKIPPGIEQGLLGNGWKQDDIAVAMMSLGVHDIPIIEPQVVTSSENTPAVTAAVVEESPVLATIVESVVQKNTITPELVEYIRANLVEGQVPQDIEQVLLESGWRREDITEAVNSLGIQATPIVTPRVFTPANQFVGSASSVATLVEPIIQESVQTAQLETNPAPRSDKKFFMVLLAVIIGASLCAGAVHYRAHRALIPLVVSVLRAQGTRNTGAIKKIGCDVTTKIAHVVTTSAVFLMQKKIITTTNL